MSVDVEQLYARYGPMVNRRCRALLRNEEQAMEATQDVFVQVLRRADALTIDAPSSMLYRVATNVCLNRIRTRKRHPEDRDELLLAQIAAYDPIDERTAASRLLARLFGGQQASTATIAVMHLLDGYTLEEVADEVGMSVSGVRKRLRGLRASLRALEEVA